MTEQKPDAESNLQPTVEIDGRFPSGAWTGFFLQGPSSARHWMELRLDFRAGTLRGDGSDGVGSFTLDGGYDVKDGRCWWIKRYVAQHDVNYTGYNEGKGIWGVWEIPPIARGGFHIWPTSMTDPTQNSLETAERAPISAGGVHDRQGGFVRAPVTTPTASNPWTLSA
jgi:hypothetical protein